MTYVISIGDDKNCYLIDCGDVEKIFEQGWKVQAVFLTHAHFDHIYGLPALLKAFPQIAIYTNEWGQKALADDKLNLSRYHEPPIRIECSNIHIVNEGDKICGFNVYETPGHDPSCICYANNDAIFTGDSYIPGTRVVTNLPHGNKLDANNSVERILILSQGKIIYPGHDGEKLSITVVSPIATLF